MTGTTADDIRGRRLEAILGIGLAVCALTLCLLWLESYPRPWFDEGITLQASKNLVLYGEYALMYTPGELVEFDPAIQAGPTVVLPIALSFYLTGIGVLQARLVMVVYALLALIVLYWLVRSVCNRWAALLTALLLMFTFDHEFTSFVFMGRQALAEVPALGFFLSGALLWFRAWECPRPAALIWSGLLWGAAMLTKIQFALVLPATLILFWLFDRISLMKLRTRHLMVPVFVSVGCLFAWFGFQALSIGFAGFWQRAAALWSAGGLHLLRFVPRRMIGAISAVMGSSLAVFGIPGLLYTFCSSLQKRDPAKHSLVFLATFTSVWLGWYAFLSIGWMRYVFVPAAMSCIFTAYLLVDLWRWAGQRHHMLLRWLPVTPGQVAVGAVVAMLLMSGIVSMIRQVIHNPDSGLQELAQYLNTHIPADAVIETWEWELDSLASQAFHHPPYELTNAFTAHIWYGAPVSPEVYDPLAAGPTYLIVGPFAEWTGVYSRDLLERRFALVESIGAYRLYEVNANAE